MLLRKNLVVAGMAGLVLSFCLAAQDTEPHIDAGTQRMLKSADIKFASDAAQGGKAEVALGQLALQKAGDPEVKAFAQKMVDDHTKANDQLQHIATERGITLPSTLDEKALILKTKLQNLSGAKFDKKYMKAQVKDHQKDVKKFKKESTHGADPALKNFASETLPVLQNHLEMAKSTDAKVK